MESIKFFYPANKVVEKPLPGLGMVREIHKLTPVGAVHLQLNDRLLCGASKDKVANGYDRGIERDARVGGLPLCDSCINEYKSLSFLGWRRWIEGKAKVV